MRLRAAAALLLSIALVGLAPLQASASFPGRNGRIAFAVLYFTTEGHGHDNRGPIMTMSPRGDDRIQLAGRHSAAPAWSPDGAFLAFFHKTKHNPEGIYIVPAEGGPPSLLRRGCWEQIAWHPSGHRLILACGRRMVVVNRRGEDIRTLPRGSDPAWSPDGRTIAFFDGTLGGIASMRPGGNKRQLLIPDAAEPDWSPNGKELAYTCGDPQSVCTANADGTGQSLLVSDATTPRWSPDGSKILYANWAFDCGALETVAKDGSKRDRLTGCYTDWAPGGYSWQPARR